MVFERIQDFVSVGLSVLCNIEVSNPFLKTIQAIAHIALS